MNEPNPIISCAQIEARIAREEAEAAQAERDTRDASDRYAIAIANAAALKLLLNLVSAYASGEPMPDVRRMSY